MNKEFDLKVASKQTVYELTIDELKVFFAEKLNVAISKINIRFLTREVGDDRFGPTHSEPAGIQVIVSETTIASLPPV